MKTNSAFKLKKEYKMIISSIRDREMRNFMKKLFIQAQVIADSTERVVFK